MAKRRQLQAADAPGTARALSVSEAGPRAPDTFILLRGNPHARGEKVTPGFPQVLQQASPVLPTAAPQARSSGRRRVLADWLASPQNPLTARVIANRIWQHHFGRGIVRSPNDFGLQGTPPTHPLLLDWLASQLVDGGWRLKRIHKLIMLSATYQMSSRGNDQALRKDPQNDFFWRFDMRRLTAEEIRDSILAVNGRLNLKMGGPGIYEQIPQEVMAGQSRPGTNWGTSDERQRARRSVYIHVKRSLITPILEQFDLADTDFTCPVRFATTQPTQALGMLNSGFVNQQARVFALRLQREAGDRPADQVRLGLQLATQRQPTAGEVARGVDLIRQWQAEDGVQPAQALEYFCLATLNLNEFLYLD